MIRLKKIEIHVNEEFLHESDLIRFKQEVTAALAKHLVNPPTVYNTFEHRENLLINIPQQQPVKT